MTRITNIIIFSLLLVLLICPLSFARQTPYDELDYIGAFGTGPLFDVDTSDVDIILHGSRNLMKVALAFDDGPFEYTNGILDILAAHNAKATFFLVGLQVEKYPKIARRIVEEGHQVGNHSYSHKLFTQVSRSTWTNQIDQMNLLVYETTQVNPKVFRPPYRGYNDEIQKYANEAGMTVVLWDVDPKDWKTSSPSLVEQRIMSHVKPGSILTLHDLSEGTRKGLGSIIESLNARGYELVTVGEMIEDYAREKEAENIS